MGEIILIIVLIVLVVALFVVSYMKKKKYNTELGQMRNELKTGDKVMTDTGVVGEVVDSFMEDEYKYFVLKTGRGNNVGYFTVHANAIYYVYGKEDSTQQKSTTVKIAPKQTAQEPETESKPEKVEETKVVEGPSVDEKKEEPETKPKKSTASTSTKKSTKTSQSKKK